MPAKEISVNELKVTGTASRVLHKSLTDNADYDGSPRGVPAGVVGEASLTTVKVMKAEKPTEVWMMINTTATVQDPPEFRGRTVYPGFVFGKSSLQDPEKVNDTVQGLIRFMRNLGIPTAQIDKAKGAKPEDFLFTAVKVIESCCGKNAARFKFTTRAQKKDPSRTECLANGPVDVEAASSGTPFEEADTKGSIPAVGEIWKYNDVACRVTAVDATENAETVDLEPIDGSDPFIGVAWFDDTGNPQIEYIR